MKSHDIMEILESMKDDIALIKKEYETLKKNNAILRTENIDFKARLDVLETTNKTVSTNTSSHTNCNNITNSNNTYNISIHIDRNTFENEDLGALDGQVKRLIKNKDGAIADIVKRLHFNDKHPKNRNIRAEGVKSGMIGIHEATENGKEWTKKPRKQALEDIAINATQQLKDKAEEEDLSVVMEDTLKKMTEPIIDPAHFDHKRKLRTECKNIEAVLLTERNAGRNPESK
tara:strand:+ start:193 stop:885 length:693 start_codon:yes stop_codon:yes gene_type:complete